jgi:kinetochore protein Nuf2
MNNALNQSMHHGHAMVKGTLFPKLTALEIIDCLRELGITITKDILAQPENNKETVKQLLEMLAILLLGIQTEELSQANFHGLQAITYHELHEESIPQLNGLRAIMKLMEICEISDFSLRDIFCPTQSRLNRQLSGIINFAKFREERIHMLYELNQQTNTLIDQLAVITEKNESANSRLLLLREQTKEDLEILHTLEKDAAEFEQQTHQIKKEQQQLDTFTDQLNQDIIQTENFIVETYQSLEDLSSDQRRLSQQVVTSPEKFRKQILEVGQALQHEQKDCKVAEKRVRELSSWLVNVEEANTEIVMALEAIQEVRGEVEKQKIMINELDGQKQIVESLRGALSELSQNTQQQQRQAMRAEEKLQQLRKQSALRAEETQRTIDDLHKQLVEAESFRVQVSITELFLLSFFIAEY